MRLIGLAVVLAVGLVLVPLAAEAQQAGKVWRIGYLQGTTLDAQLHLVHAFEAGLREKGYVLGRDLVIESRFADGHPERLAALAADLVRLKVDILVTGVDTGVAAARAATTTIPIVMAGSFNPVEEGFISSLARPGGNITGLVQDTGVEIQGKRLQILREIVPNASRIVALSGAGMSYNAVQVKALDAAGHRLGLTIVPVVFRGGGDVADAFEEIQHSRARGLVVFGGPLVLEQRARIIGLALKSRLPAIYTTKQYVVDGGCVSYGADVTDLWRRAAGYVDKILKGAKPADLPVEQPSKFELVINLKTAKTLGLTIPQTLLLQADQVIE
jgi:putative tryptophan/tyrosine transport system substrate-binding protein